MAHGMMGGSGKAVDLTGYMALINDGVEKKRHGDYLGAKRSYYEAIQLFPTQRAAYASLAKVCYLLGEREESILNYLRSAHFAVHAQAGLVGADPKVRRNFEDKVRQHPSGLGPRLMATHQYAPYLMADPDTPCHIAHAVIDLDAKSSLRGNLIKHIEVYRQVLAGRLSNDDLDWSVEDEVYWLRGVEFLLNHLKWDSMGNREVLRTYPDPKPKW